MRGEVVYLFAFDVAYEMLRQPIPELLGHPVEPYSVDVSKRIPRQISFYRPQIIRLPPLKWQLPSGEVEIKRSVKLLAIGAVSISLHVPFEVGRIGDLVPYHDLAFAHGTLHQEVRKLAEQVRTELGKYCVRPLQKLEDEEAYTVFCLEAPVLGSDGQNQRTEAWLKEHRREVAALLTQEPVAQRLSDQEAGESTDKYLSYYEQDLQVVDWDAALVIDHPKDFDEALYIFELANLQLVELAAYDRILDAALERAYRDLGQKSSRRRLRVQRELRELRIDMARFSDELLNTTKFFGDWHLARVYQTISARFHLTDWHRIVEEKLKTLDELYELLQHEQNNRWMLIMEVTVVLLFVAEIALALGGHK